jgi:IBR domain, a half RING-finger domain
MCLEKISGYEHFQTNRACWDTIESGIADTLEETVKDWAEFEDFKEELGKAEDVIMEKALENCIRCPKCMELNSRNDNINRIICSKCKHSFCFQCGQKVTEDLAHYDVSNCYYKGNRDEEVKKEEKTKSVRSGL